ncbi:pyridoxamine 5'-phosphate oxidase [Tianweitania populi]|uniref:Pyridoxine/pyridoxamine 5'-phosphate oxidase n=1 Tax=Tianweitania populi TaxID=1607949 RepID=A0A8J3GK77_9HYPH|nr:pyridoxamine 5'-phosphate oxidase [Tianweitania populi]GHD05849.1 pyridoxine/pyridoxamine 5'-phosphate oxidase [Tianweitania populi]
MNDTPLTSSDFAATQNPFELFGTWLDEATTTEINDPNAVAVATVDPTGMPNVRVVLLKEFDARGYTFYTNYESAKGQEILSARKAAMCFHWKSLRRQVRIRGDVELVSDAEADAYYNTRPRGSRIGAWASQQSRPLESRDVLEKAVAQITKRYGDGDIPRPAHWSGFRIVPDVIEFWRDMPYRLHDRIVFTRDGESWTTERLYP